MGRAAGESTWVDVILGGDIPYITYAVPFFFVLIAIESGASIVAGLKLYRLNDSISDLSCGIIDQMVKVLIHAAVLGAYVFTYEHFRVATCEDWPPFLKYMAAAALFLGVDFCFYWHHRFVHEFAIGWAVHSVHHQSEDFNLIVALRQSALEHHFTIFFYLPLALVGFPVNWFVAMFAFNLIWQFWCHTQLVGRLGPIEWLFVTPSHHRVHHARNPKYLDRNYGGTLIVWDRLFGTFAREEEAPVYGVTKPIRSWNPVWANLAHWFELMKLAASAPHWRDKVRIWFMRLNWRPEGLPPAPDPPEVSPSTVVKYDAKPPARVLHYALSQLGVTFAIGFGFLFALSDKAVFSEVWDLAAFILMSLLAVNGLIEGKRWAIGCEYVRLISMPVVAWRQSDLTAWPMLAVSLAFVIAGASLIWFARVNRRRERPIRIVSAVRTSTALNEYRRAG